MAGSLSSGASGSSAPSRTASTLATVWAAIASQDRGATAAWRRARRRSRSRLRAPWMARENSEGSLAIQTSRRSSSAPATSVVTTGRPAAR